MYTFQAMHCSIPSGNPDGTAGKPNTALSAKQCFIYGDDGSN